MAHDFAFRLNCPSVEPFISKAQVLQSIVLKKGGLDSCREVQIKQVYGPKKVLFRQCCQLLLIDILVGVWTVPKMASFILRNIVGNTANEVTISTKSLKMLHDMFTS